MTTEPALNVRGILFKEMHAAAIQVTAAYAASDNANPDKIPALFREMLRAQREAIAADEEKDKTDA